MTKTTHFWWVRHAPVVNNGGLVYGGGEIDADVSNTALFEGLAARLPKKAVYLASGLRRTHQTLAAVRAAGREDIPIKPRGYLELNEQNLGDWQGQPIAELFSKGGPWPGFWMTPADNLPPNGESFAQLCERVSSIVPEIAAEYAGKHVVVAAHGGTIRGALAQALNLSPAQALAFGVDNCSTTRIDHYLGNDGEVAWGVPSVNLPAVNLPAVNYSAAY
jgi:alpha-ribazole phosphatase